MYFVRISVPINTLVSAPIIRTLDIAPGRLSRIRIVFPIGCYDLVGLWIEYLGSRLYPINDNEFFRGNGGVIEFLPDVVVDKSPYSLSIKCFSEDDTYVHAPTVLFEMEFFGGAIEKHKSTGILSMLPSLPGRRR